MGMLQNFNLGRKWNMGFCVFMLEPLVTIHCVVLHQILNTWSIVDLNAERVPTRHITKKTHMSTLTNNKKFTRRHHCLFVYVVIINIRIFVALFGLSLN